MTDATANVITDVILHISLGAFVLMVILAAAQLGLAIRLGRSLGRPIATLVFSFAGAIFSANAPSLRPAATEWLATHLPHHAAASQSTDSGAAAVILIVLIPGIVMLSMGRERR